MHQQTVDKLVILHRIENNVCELSLLCNDDTRTAHAHAHTCMHTHGWTQTHTYSIATFTKSLCYMLC